MKKTIKLLLILLFINSATISVSAADDVFNFNNGAKYTSWDYYETAQALVNTYPDILSLDVIGYSLDSKPIYSIIMTDNVQNVKPKADFNISRMHYYVEAGNHARETVNTAIVMEMVENYARDYYDDNVIPEFNLKEELKVSAIHFIPLVNPDGYDLTKFGLASITTEKGKSIIVNVPDKKYRLYKANIAGVDLNRNFPDIYYDFTTKTWIDKFQVHTNKWHSNKPNGEFFSGPFGGSEPETQAIMNYIKKYDFRAHLSYHSRGEVIYNKKPWFSDEFNNRAYNLGKLLCSVSGYKQIDNYLPTDFTGSGYLSDFVVAETLKPSLTIETTTAPVPTAQKYYTKAYKDTHLLPLYTVVHGKEVGYFTYRLYVDNVYIRDFSQLEYAEAHMMKNENSIVVSGEGTPRLYLVEPELIIETIQRIQQ